MLVVVSAVATAAAVVSVSVLAIGAAVRARLRMILLSWLTALVTVGALCAGLALVLSAWFEDNSAEPMPFAVGLIAVFVPPVLVGSSVMLWDYQQRRRRAAVGTMLGASFLILATLGLELTSDAAACHDDDCIPLNRALGLLFLGAPATVAAAISILVRKTRLSPS